MCVFSNNFLPQKKERKGPSAARASKRNFGISIDAARVVRPQGDTITSVMCAFLCGGQNVNENSNGLRSKTLKIRAKFQRFFPSTNDLQSCFDQKRDLFDIWVRKQREKKGKKGEKETRYFSFLFSFTCDTSKMCAGELIFKEAIFFLSYEYYEERDVFLPPRYNMCVCGDVVSFF